MSYVLNAAVGPFALLRTFGPGQVVPLRHRMGLVLAGDAIGEDDWAAWSRAGDIAQVEADFFGGDGYQTASLWRDGRRVWGPVHDADFTGPRAEWPINAVLARLGVVLDPGAGRPDYHDLFIEVGLGAERDHQDWRELVFDGTYEEWEAARAASQQRRR